MRLSHMHNGTVIVHVHVIIVIIVHVLYTHNVQHLLDSSEDNFCRSHWITQDPVKMMNALNVTR